VVAFGVLPPGLLQDTNACTRLELIFFAFAGCGSVTLHATAAALAMLTLPSTSTAAAAAKTCFFMVTLLRRVGWGWQGDAQAGEVHDTPEDSDIGFAISVIPGSLTNVIFSN
jgi:hypothetical protein